MKAFLLAALMAAFLIPTADAQMLRCKKIDALAAHIKRDHPKATVHELTEEEFRRFKERTGLERGDAVVYFASEGIPTLYVVVTYKGCAVNRGFPKREAFEKLIGPAGDPA